MIYPLVAHGVYGGGWLQVNVGGKPVMDFAGSSVVHLTGAVGALAALLLLGARRGKYGPDGKPRPIPGHSMPHRRPRCADPLGRLVRVQRGLDVRHRLDGNLFAEVALNTQLAAAAGCAGRDGDDLRARRRRWTSAWPATAQSRAWSRITAPSGYVEFWVAPIIGAVAGVIVVFGILAIDKKLDDPVGALSAHGLAGIWGTLSIGSVRLRAADPRRCEPRGLRT